MSKKTSKIRPGFAIGKFVDFPDELGYGATRRQIIRRGKIIKLMKGGVIKVRWLDSPAPSHIDGWLVKSYKCTLVPDEQVMLELLEL